MGRPSQCGCCGGVNIGYWSGLNRANYTVSWPSEATIIDGITDSNLNSSNLSIVVMGTAPPTSFGYTSKVPSATTESTTFLDNGGTILMMTDYKQPVMPTGCSNFLTATNVAAVNNVLTGVGSSMAWQNTDDPSPSCLLFDSGAFAPNAHSLMSGVSNIYIAAPGYLTLGSGTALLTATNDVIAVENVSNGRVILFVDSTAPISPSAPTYDLDVFLQNIYDTA